MPSAFSLKLAQTEDELKQAWRLVRQQPYTTSSKQEDFSTTAIFIAKWYDEVVGTISLITEGEGGRLPCDQDHSLKSLRTDNIKIAEISALNIKKDFRLRRSAMVLPLCKMMYQYCTTVLNIDVIVTSVSKENVAFYTDVLLFKKLHPKSNVCFLSLTDEVLSHYRTTYSHKERAKNLYHFFIEHHTACIQLPLPECRREGPPRLDLKIEAMAFINGSKKAAPCSILNFSANGLQILLTEMQLVDIGHPVLIVFERGNQYVVCPAQIKWLESAGLWGCQIVEKSYSWQKFIHAMDDQIITVKAA